MSSGRKTAIAGFVLVAACMLTVAALYLSAVLFLLVNKANPAQATLTSIADYWRCTPTMRSSASA